MDAKGGHEGGTVSRIINQLGIRCAPAFLALLQIWGSFGGSRYWLALRKDTYQEHLWRVATGIPRALAKDHSFLCTNSTNER